MIVVKTTSIADQLAVLLYPNPATNFVRVDFNKKVDKGNLTVFDLHGRAIISKAISNARFENLFINRLAAGLYIIQVKVAGAV